MRVAALFFSDMGDISGNFGAAVIVHAEGQYTQELSSYLQLGLIDSNGQPAVAAKVSRVIKSRIAAGNKHLIAHENNRLKFM